MRKKLRRRLSGIKPRDMRPQHSRDARVVVDRILPGLQGLAEVRELKPREVLGGNETWGVLIFCISDPAPITGSLPQWRDLE